MKAQVQQNKTLTARLLHILKRIIQYTVIFAISGFMYQCIEIAFRGYTHWTMFICAGICGLFMALVNDYIYSFETDFRIQVLTSGLFCAIIEYGIGEIFNKDYSIWDYRGLWGTLTFLDSQVNILFICAWLLISALGIPFLDWLEWKMGIGERPYYRIGKRKIFTERL